MTTPNSSPSDRVWEAIEKEKRRDRFIRRVGMSAWSVTFILVLLLTVLEGLSIAQLVKGVMVGALPWMTVFGAALPFVIVLGFLSVLIATLATIGMFLRMRTTTLSEIQLRLAALEEMIAARER